MDLRREDTIYFSNNIEIKITEITKSYTTLVISAPEDIIISKK